MFNKQDKNEKIFEDKFNCYRRYHSTANYNNWRGYGVSSVCF